MSDLPRITVGDVMKRKYDLVDGLATVSDAVNQMKHTDTKCLVVDKRDSNDEYGIVMLADISKQVLGRDRSPNRVNIYEIMSKPVISVDPEMDIRYCARLFEKFGISRAPVVEHRKVIGIVSHTDIVLKGLASYFE
ncbi:MAG: CBS domain-containing protein [bacterium]